MRSRLAALALLGVVAATAAVGSPDGTAEVRLRLKFAEFDPRLTQPHADETGAGYFVVQFDRALRPSLLAGLSDAGAQPIGYVPDQAYLVKVPEAGAARLRALPAVRWVGPVEPGWKLAPDLGTRELADPGRRDGGRLTLTIDLFPGESLADAVVAANRAGAEVLQTHAFSDVRRLLVKAPSEALARLAAIPAVGWIEEAGELTLRNDTARWVVQSNTVGSTSIWNRGLHGENQIVGVIDDRMDPNSCYFVDPLHPLPGPSHRKLVAYRSSSGIGAGSHGTHVAGSLAGDQSPINGTNAGNGGAPAAKIAFANLLDIDGIGGQDSNLYEYFAAAHADGARIHSNSWGDDGTTSYTTWSRDVDLFSWDHEDALVLFAVTNLPALRTPENAKNVLAVGASQNGTSSDQHCSGGVGPTFDGRRKPEIYAPGCSIYSARESTNCGTQDLTGTSMACPAVAAAGALVRQYFEEGWHPAGAPQPGSVRAPSGALVKAVLLNSSVDMSGVPGYPSTLEGWGRILLENGLYFAGETRRLAVLADVRNAQGLSTGGSVALPFTVTGATERLDLTLVFTEPAAALFASPVTINNLDLELQSPSGVIWRGNVFSNGVSTPGGTADALNNVERISIPAPQTGVWFARVIGTAVNQSTQGFALVANGQVTEAGSSLLRFDGYGVDDSGPLGNGNGRIDPGETVLVPVDVRNLLSNPALGVVARLRGGPAAVTITDPEAAFPALPGQSSRATLAPHFRVSVPPGAACAAPIPLTLDIVHGDATHTSAFDLELGTTLLRRNAPNVPLAVPASGVVESLLPIGDAITIGDVNAAVHIQHANVAELTVQLTSPMGTTVTLYAGSAGGADLIATFDREHVIDGPGSMNDFNGQAGQGTWRLTVKDTVAGGTPAGTIVSWSLYLEPPGAPACTPLTCGSQGTPGNVGPTLRLGKSSADLVFTWSAVSGAAAYRVWRSEDRAFPSPNLVSVGPATAQIESGGVSPNGTILTFYRVNAINACEWQGP